MSNSVEQETSQSYKYSQDFTDSEDSNQIGSPGKQAQLNQKKRFIPPLNHEFLKQHEQYIQDRKFVDIKLDLDSQLLIEILKKSSRTLHEIQFLKYSIMNLNIFRDKKNIFNANESTVWFNKHIKLEYVHKNDVIFQYGELGNTYYIILQGNVFCLIPKPDYHGRIPQSPARVNRTQANPASESIFKITKLKEQVQKIKLIQDVQKNELKHSQEDQEFVQDRYPSFNIAKIYTQGEAFGEIALVTRQRRTATMVAKENTYLMTLSKQGFDKILGSFERHKMEEKLKFFQGFNFFKVIPNSKLLAIIKQIKLLPLQIHHEIFNESQLVDSVYFVKTGEIEYSKVFESEQKLKEYQKTHGQFSSVEKYNLRKLNLEKNLCKMRIALSIIGQGGLFGEEEVLNNEEIRSSRAVVRSLQAEVFQLPKEVFLANITQYKTIDQVQRQADLKSVIYSQRAEKVENTNSKQQEKFQQQITKLESKKLKWDSTTDNMIYRSAMLVKQTLQRETVIAQKIDLKDYKQFPIINQVEIPKRFSNSKYQYLEVFNMFSKAKGKKSGKEDSPRSRLQPANNGQVSNSETLPLKEVQSVPDLISPKSSLASLMQQQVSPALSPVTVISSFNRLKESKRGDKAASTSQDSADPYFLSCKNTTKVQTQTQTHDEYQMDSLSKDVEFLKLMFRNKVAQQQRNKNFVGIPTEMYSPRINSLSNSYIHLKMANHSNAKMNRKDPLSISDIMRSHSNHSKATRNQVQKEVETQNLFSARSYQNSQQIIHQLNSCPTARDTFSYSGYSAHANPSAGCDKPYMKWNQHTKSVANLADNQKTAVQNSHIYISMKQLKSLNRQGHHRISKSINLQPKQSAKSPQPILLQLN